MFKQKLFGIALIIIGWIGSDVAGDYLILVFLGFIAIILLISKRRIIE